MLTQALKFCANLRRFRLTRLLTVWAVEPRGFATEVTASRVTCRPTSPVREGLPLGEDLKLSEMRFEGGRAPQSV